VEGAGLGVLEEGGVEERLERIGGLDDRLGIVGDQDPELSAESHNVKEGV
jgi:hypothetical protein